MKDVKDVNIIKQRLYQVQIKEVQRIAPIKKFSHEAISGKPSKEGKGIIKNILLRAYEVYVDDKEQMYLG